MSFVIEPFDPNKKYSDYNNFSCGHSVIDRFVRSSLRNQVRQGLSIGYALLDTSQKDRFAGFFTIASHAIPMNQLSTLKLGSLPRTIPCVRLIMLAVNKSDAGAGLGSLMLNHAFDIAKMTSKFIGCYGMYLDADPNAIKFYEKIGFLLLEDDKSRTAFPMFILMGAIP